MDALRALTELKYQKSLTGLAEILAQEAKLRNEIKRLRDHAAEAQSLPVTAHSMRNIGADVIWLRWVAKATRTLNIELAQVLARKEALLANQRRALGRKTVADTLADEAHRSARADQDARVLNTSIEVDLMRRLRNQ
ncbi:hypothetical protein [uncultured Tateyamaria sp.]|uniref:hypothetical protein n=1 Tax=Tateyamaria sp. 1078 TaxID=3417464 RepID=UPI00262A8739|nr:hypothetical protein [uncultured Tateyamaria sp.]